MKINLRDLVVILRNEKATKKLLNYNRMFDDISNIVQENLKNRPNNPVVATIKELEAEHIKYILKQYILTRIEKIRMNIPQDTSLMSHAEKIFYLKYYECLSEQNIFKDKINISSFDDPFQKQNKQLEYVAFICTKKISGFKVDGTVIEVYEGDFFVAKFDEVEEYFERGDIMHADLIKL